jgi:hypothetical protein
MDALLTDVSDPSDHTCRNTMSFTHSVGDDRMGEKSDAKWVCVSSPRQFRSHVHH